jgi:GT2 family glycosyltransferase
VHENGRGAAKGRVAPYDIAASIVAFHAEPAMLRELIESLLATSLAVRVTVVDNSPTDALGEVVRAAGGIYLHSERNVGFGAGHNIALRETLHLARYHAVVNPDIVLGRETLDRLHGFMEANPSVGQAMPAILNSDGSEQRLTKRLPSPSDLFLRRFLGGLGQRLAPRRWLRYEMRDVDLSTAHDVPCLSGCFMFVRSAVLEQVGLFDERFFMYMEDVDLCRRIGAVSRTIFFPEASLFHGYAKGSYRDYRLMLLHLESAAKYFNKWGWIFDLDRGRRNRACRVFEQGKRSLDRPCGGNV